MADELKGQEAMKAMPFFYTDIRSRLVPGFFSLVVLGMIGLRPPKPYRDWLSRDNSITAVVVPLLIVALSYVLGDIIEVTLRNTWDRIDDWVFPAALKKHKLTYPEFEIKIDPKSYRHQLWHWLTILVPQEYPEAFIHAARFQSEAKMFLNASVPGTALTVISVFHQSGNLWWSCFWGAICILVCWTLAFFCERRRWLQALAARQLGFEPEGTGSKSKAARR